MKRGRHQPQTRRQKKKFASHGSLSKAGRIRDSNKSFVVWRLDDAGKKVLSKVRRGRKGKTKGGLPFRGKKKDHPLVSNRKSYNRMLRNTNA